VSSSSLLVLEQVIAFPMSTCWRYHSAATPIRPTVTPLVKKC